MSANEHDRLEQIAAIERRIEQRWDELVKAADDGELWDAVKDVPPVSEQLAELARERPS